jgi:pyruvate formate lyase activating enzyme
LPKDELTLTDTADIIRVGGFEALSMCDWPGEIVATVFCQGCPWDCSYCHNPALLPATGEQELPWQDILMFLESRRGLLDGVVFSGGEPTLQRGLGQAIAEVRAMGFRIGLHTGGAYPRRLAEVLPMIDWVGFDIKSSFADYKWITRASGSGPRARASLGLLLDSGVDYELRTTVSPDFLDTETLGKLADELEALGAKNHKLQECRHQT